MPIRLLTALPDTPDVRDHIAAPAAVILPSRVDLSAWLGPVKDQGKEGACTAFAGSGILEFLYRKFRNDDSIFSPQFLYRGERIIDGDITQDSGAQSRTMMVMLARYGTCLETSDPYFDSGWRTPTTLVQLAEARKYRIGAYHRVPDLLTLKSVLASGYVASLGIDVFGSFLGDEVANTGEVPLPRQNEGVDGGHEVYTFGYDDDHVNADRTNGALLVRNSWGLGWGFAGSGNFYLPYDYWPYVSDCWTAHLGHAWK